MCKKYTCWSLLILFTAFINLTAQDTIAINTENVAKKYDCFSPKKRDKVFLIKNVGDGKANLFICNNIFADDTLDVDFISHDMLFCTIGTSGGINKFTYKLYKIPKEKKYLLLITIEKKPIIPEMLVIQRIIELTPKLDVDYSIEYRKVEICSPVPPVFINR